MSIALWILAGLLTVSFLAAGAMKLTGKREQMLEKMPWLADVPQPQIKAIGAIEVLGALGLVLPALTGIAPVLVPVAATGLALVMAGAVVVHLRRGDGLAGATSSLVLGVLALALAVGRFGPAAF